VRAAMPGRPRLGGITFPVARTGLAGAEGDLPAESRPAAKEALLLWADMLDAAVESIHGADIARVHDLLASVEVSYDLAAEGWREGRASKTQTLAVLRQLLAEAERAAPSWFEERLGTPPKQVDAFAAVARATAIRMRARAESGDFERPAALSLEEAREVAKAEGVWEEKVHDDERRADLDRCSPARMLTGETTLGEYWATCVPQGVRYAAYGVAAFLAWRLYRWVTR